MKPFYLIPLIFLLSGCALMRDHITIAYNPTFYPVEEIVQVENIPVAVNVTDGRNHNAVGCKKNGYGMEMAYIIAKNDITQVLKEAIEIELQKRGFVISKGATEVCIEICKFKNNFEMGFFSSDSQSESISHVIVKDQNGTVKFSKIVMGLGCEKNCFLMMGKNARLALEAALGDTVQKIVNDPIFIDSLIRG